MPNFLIDPYITEVPLSGLPDDGWLLKLDSWLADVATSPFSWYHLLDCTFALMEAGRFPDFDLLRKAARGSTLDVNIALLVRRLNTFFQDERRDFPAAIEPHEVALNGTAIFSPTELVARHGCSRAVFELGLICLACGVKLGDPIASGTTLVTAAFREAAMAFRVEATIALADPLAHEAALIGPLDQSVPVSFEPNQLAQFLTAAVAQGVDDEQFLAAVGILARVSHSGPLPVALSKCGTFWSSLGHSGIARDSSAMLKLLRVCAEIATGRIADGSANLRKIRKSLSGDSEQVRRDDGATAWRATIVTAGVGWRLHFWSGAVGTARFAELVAVVKKGDPVTMPQ